MKDIIKKRLILLLTVLPMITTSSFSTTSKKIEQDTIVSITPTQLKETNLIFAEHNKLLKENKLLKDQISNYKTDNQLLLNLDSIKNLQIANYEQWNNSLSKQVNKNKKELLLWKVGGITVSTSLLILLLIK